MRQNKDESVVLEYKVELPKKNKTWLKSIVSFSNTSGGKLIVGIEDETLKIIGLNEDKDELKHRIEDLIHEHISPKPNYVIEFAHANGKDILIVKVSKGDETPYVLHDGEEHLVYVRYGETDQIASEVEVKELYMKSIGETFSSLKYIDSKHDFHVVDQEEAQAFLDIINKNAKNRAKIKDLVGWGVLIDEDEVLYATNGYMLMTKNPFKECYIKISVFETSNRQTLMREIKCRGSIIQQYQKAFRVIDKILNKDTVKIPTVTLMEIIVNAVVHRQYMENRPIIVELYSDHMLTYSPGPLINGLTINDMLAGISKLRNKNIGDVFYHMDIIERYGKGFDRINNALEKNQQKPAKVSVGNAHGVGITVYFKE